MFMFMLIYVAPWSCETRHFVPLYVHKCSGMTIKLNLNLNLIKYITCMHSFKAALITFLVTSWLNWSRHCMHVVYFALIWNDKGYSAPAPLCVQLKITRCGHRTVSTLFWLAPAAEEKWSARLKRLPFDVIVKTFCNWINTLLVKRKTDRNSSCEWGGKP